MTEHKKISLKGAQPAKAGDSLFERANGAFGLDSFKPAALPKFADAAPRAKRKSAPRKPEMAPLAPAKSEPSPVAENPAIIEPKPAEVATKAEPAPAKQEKPEPAMSPAPAKRISAPVREPETQPIAEQVSFGSELHTVDRDHLAELGMIVPDGPVTGLLEEFRIVKRQLLSDARKAGTAIARRILVCSPHSGEGKTYCATNLALALAAERDIEVLLVDADFPKPSILETLGLESERGFMDALSDKSLQPEKLVLRTDIDGLFVLPAGNRTTSDAEYLASARTSEVLARLTDSAPDRIVIFDTPPALAASPAAELAKHVGQAVLVARADDTGRNALEDAYQLLSACPDIKMLLNGAQFSPSGRSFGSYGVYGE